MLNIIDNNSNNYQLMNKLTQTKYSTIIKIQTENHNDVKSYS